MTHYYNENDERIEVSIRQLVSLVESGDITPDTRVEITEGNIILARRVRITDRREGSKTKLPFWHYFDEFNTKTTVTFQQLVSLVESGDITPDTRIEDSEGNVMLAKDVRRTDREGNQTRLPFWYYFNERDEKIAATFQQLVSRVESGDITPDTRIEFIEGNIVPAESVRRTDREGNQTRLPFWYYFDESDEKIAATLKQLQQLVQVGTITRETRVITSDDRTCNARDVEDRIFPPTPQPAKPDAVAAPDADDPFGATPSSIVQPVQPPDANRPFCTNCGQPVSEQAVMCLSCYAKPTGHRRFCRQCAAALNPDQVLCIKCGAEIKGSGETKSKVAAGLLGILAGSVGAHKFYLGSWGWGLIFLACNPWCCAPLSMLVYSLITLITFGFGAILGFLLIVLVPLWIGLPICGIIEGIIYLIMSDEAFAKKYSPETQSPFRW